MKRLRRDVVPGARLEPKDGDPGPPAGLAATAAAVTGPVCGTQKPTGLEIGSPAPAPPAAAGTGRCRGRAALIQSATLAANSHNAQAWRFLGDDSGITLLPDFTRRTPIVDPDDHHLFVSLGAAAENMVHAAPAVGLVGMPSFDPTEGGRIRVALRPGKAPLTNSARPLPAGNAPAASMTNAPCLPVIWRHCSRPQTVPVCPSSRIMARTAMASLNRADP